MSADNGVYIIQIPTQSGNEYGVITCFESTVDLMFSRTLPKNVCEAHTVILLKDAKSFQTEEESYMYAKELYLTLDICEYGICSIELESPISDINVEEANKIIDDYWM